MNELFELRADQDCYTIVIKRDSNLAKRILSFLLSIDERDFTSKQIPTRMLSQKTETFPIKNHTPSTTNTSLTITPSSWPFEVSVEDIEQKKLLKGEYEWILLYGYVLLSQGIEDFGKPEIKQVYTATNRLTQNNYKSFSTNIKKCLDRGYFSINQTSLFTVTDEGKNHICKRLMLK